MAFWNKKVETKKSQQHVEIKSLQELMNLIVQSGSAQNVSHNLAYQYFKSVAPVGDAVKKIADAIAALELIVIDDEEVNSSYGVLELINNGSPFASRQQILRELSKSAALTAETWVVLRGRVTASPVSLDVIRPYHVRINGTDMITSIVTDSPIDKRTYNVSQKDGRMISDDGLNELIYAAGNVDEGGFRAESPLNSISLEIEQYKNGAVHNNALLKNGFSPSLLLVTRENAGDAELDAAEARLKTAQGPANAGGMMMVGGIADKIELSKSNVDMDYGNLVLNALTRIYSLFGIPLPLVIGDSMTLNNYEIAQESLYDRGVDPIFSIISQLFERIDKVRYGDGGRVWYNQHRIPALQRRSFRTAKEMRETSAYTTDEVRAITGFKSIDGGDTVLAPSTLIPLE